MAKVTINMPEELLVKLSKLKESSDDIAQKVLEAGGEVVLKKVKSNLSSVVGANTKYEPRSTGELEASIGLSPVKLDKNGNHNIKVGFAEPRKDGGSNAKLAAILEYGKSGQPPKPFMAPAKAASRTACQNAMKEKLKKEVGDL